MDIDRFLPLILDLHEQVRGAVVSACEETAIETQSAVVRDDAGDTIYAVDDIAEQIVIEFFTSESDLDEPIVLIAEGLRDGRRVLPDGAREADAKWRIIVDPIDGTRGLMFQKRSAWILTGVAPNKGPETTLADIELAVQTEIPLIKQHLSDVLWAIKGRGPGAVRFDRISGESREIELKPSQEPSIAHGFASIARFIAGVGPRPAMLYDAIVREVLGSVEPGKAQCFEDQYISTGGQLYELIAGHDRFVADLRPLFENAGVGLGLCCHPYDLCTELIARELGVIVTDEKGRPLNAKLGVEPNVAWIGHANEAIRRQVEPVLMAEIREFS